MSTTKEFQKIPDFFYKTESIKSVNTNPRYPNFNQTHFTAGDIDQFEKYRDCSNGKNPFKQIKVENEWTDMKVGEHLDWKKYTSLTTESVDNTFLYLFEKFKKGVFVKIKDNKLAVFLPFSKHNYVNEWGDRMIQPPEFKTMQDFLIHSSKLQGYSISPKDINKFTNKWYANNCLVRNEFPTGENDRGISNLKDLLETLCAEREVPDIELFFNRRDFPLIKDSTEPYEHIFDQEKFPLLSHKYDKYCPILSMVTTDSHRDIPFPTMEDWARASYQDDNKLFAPNFRKYDDFKTEWDKKIPTAIFRGASTGCGVDVKTNPRLKLAFMSKHDRLIEDGFPLLDAGITKWNCRPRKIMKQKYLKVIDPSKLFLSKVNELSPLQQSNYKYIINVDGHVSAFRISYELSMGSVILLQKSKYRVWFRNYLEEYKHYVPIKEDLSDLYEKIRWCRQHDNECREIAKNARLFYDTYLTKKGILDFTQNLFVNIKQVTGTYLYNYGSVNQLIYQKQLELLPKCDSLQNPIYPFEKDINAMAGLALFFSKHQFLNDKPKKELYKGKDSSIQTFNLDKIKLNMKTSIRKKELVNEAFVGLKCINKLLKDIPNFKYTFGFQDEILFTEHIEGILFSEYIKTCSVIELTSILKIIFLALSVAQEKCGFVHNDLACWNIIIQEFKTPIRIIYQIKDEIFEVNTSLLPIIIDYDRSHVIHEEFHYGIIHPFKTSTVQDCFTVVIKSINEYIKTHQQIKKDDLVFLLYMVNFLSETDFHKKSIVSLEELIDFISSNTKYNEIVYKNKCDLEKFKPYDFFEHFDQIPLSPKINIQNVDGKKIVKPYTFVNPKFFYNMILSKDNKDEISEYIDKISEQVLKKIDGFTCNFIYYVDAINKIYLTLINLLLFLEKYNKDFDTTKCKTLLQHITLQYDKLKTTKMSLNSEFLVSPIFNPSFVQSKYTPSTFSIPSKILSILQGNVNVLNKEYVKLWKMISETLLYEKPFVLPNEKEFGKKYGRLLSFLSPLAVTNHNANIKTLHWMSKHLYEIDLEHLDESKQMNVIKNILAICNL